jgi:hypothetical protein
VGRLLGGDVRLVRVPLPPILTVIRFGLVWLSAPYTRLVDAIVPVTNRWFTSPLTVLEAPLSEERLPTALTSVT